MNIWNEPDYHVLPPRFTWLDSCCRYVGQWRNEDLYFCGSKDEPDKATVIAVCSNRAGDYHSGMVFAQSPYGKRINNNASANFALFVAKKRAIQMGLFVEPQNVNNQKTNTEKR